ncbi:MAG: FAD-binding protein [Planctomycetes bacterium]|nr:FAD-binding protein [Planctomycetota bacterium]
MSRERFVAPADEDELRRLVVEANAADRGLLVGGGLEEPERLPGEEDHLAIGLGRLRGIVAFEPGDLTITARSGTTVAALQEAAAAAGQRLAIEPARPESRSLGAAVALGEDGFIAALYGELREQVLGLRAITGAGEILRPGGRVVKNVTGYDLRKLLCGSAGRLAIISELSFRLRPLPVAEASFVFAGLEEGAALERGRELRRLDHKIAGLALRRDRAGHLLALRAEGAPAAIEALAAELRGAERLEPAAARALWRELAACPAPWDRRLVLRHRPAQLGRVLDLIGREGDLVVDLVAGRLRLPARDGESLPELLERSGRPWLRPELAVLAAMDDPREAELVRRGIADLGAPSGRVAEIESRLVEVFDPRGLLMRGRRPRGLP